MLDEQQHNTYDIEFYGLSSLTNSIFYAALKAGAEMAEHLGETEDASRYRNALENGSETMDEVLWTGEYYRQEIEDVNEYRLSSDTKKSPLYDNKNHHVTTRVSPDPDNKNHHRVRKMG